MKICSFFIFILLMINMSSTSAAFYSSSTMQSLEDDELALVVGQDGTIQTATDPHPMYEYRLMNALTQVVEMGQQADLSMLTSMFYVNDFGQTVLQINQDLVSIGTIEFRLHVNGLQDMGNMIAEQLMLKK
jgi:predicted molibdopterin-dependent oxidoreductase YjgC